MTGGTPSHRARDTVLFSFRAGFIVVADKTTDLMDGEMGALDNLGMAGRAADLHPPPERLEVFPMGEGYILVDHISLEILDFMTLKTG